MRRSALLGIACCLFAVLALRCSYGTEYYGNVMQFWELGLGSRTAALGGAACSLSDDASAILYNPAGLAWLQGHSVLSTAQTHLGVGTYGHVTASLRNTAVSLHYFNFGTIQQTDVDGNPIGTFFYRKMGLLLGAGFEAREIPVVSRLRQSDLLALGATVKITSIDTLDPGDGLGVSSIIGILINVPAKSHLLSQLPPFSVGISIEDAISIPITYDSGHRELPIPEVHVGIAIKVREDSSAVLEAASDESFHLGLEWSPSSSLTLRAGAEWAGLWLPSCGVEFAKHNLRLCLSMTMHSVLGPSWRGTFAADWD